MKITVRCGSSEISYEHETEIDRYPAIFSRDRYSETLLKGDFVMVQIERMCLAAKTMENSNG